jgi:ankyrin repeat protein
MRSMYRSSALMFPLVALALSSRLVSMEHDLSVATILLDAAQAGDYDRVCALLDRNVDPQVTDDRQQTPLIRAAEHGHQHIVRRLILSGALSTSYDADGATALHYAARQGHLGVMAALLLESELDIAVDARTHIGQTPLWWAAAHGQDQAAFLLIWKKADLNAPDMFGVTPLHAAVQAGNFLVAQMLIQNGADVTRTDIEGRTALHYAAQAGHEDLVWILRSAGARTDIRDRMGRLPRDYAALSPHPAVIYTLDQELPGRPVLPTEQLIELLLRGPDQKTPGLASALSAHHSA